MNIFALGKKEECAEKCSPRLVPFCSRRKLREPLRALQDRYWTTVFFLPQFAHQQNRLRYREQFGKFDDLAKVVFPSWRGSVSRTIFFPRSERIVSER
jgi:hypothetical protein